MFHWISRQSWGQKAGTKILEWVAVPFSKGSSQPRMEPRSPTLQTYSLPSEPPGKPKISYLVYDTLLQHPRNCRVWRKLAAGTAGSNQSWQALLAGYCSPRPRAAQSRQGREGPNPLMARVWPLQSTLFSVLLRLRNSSIYGRAQANHLKSCGKGA